MTTKVSFVVLLIDDYTGKAIESPALASVQTECAPVGMRQVIKPDGYRVFTGINGKLIRVNIRSSKYIEQRLTIDTEKLDPREPVVIVRLFPKIGLNSSGRFTSIQMKIVSEQGKPVAGHNIGLVVNGNMQYMLMEDVKAGSETIRLFLPEKAGMIGRKLIFLSAGMDESVGGKKEPETGKKAAKNNRGTFESAIIAQQYAMNEFGLASMLKRDYSMDTKILIYRDVSADQNGDVFCPLNLRKEQPESVTVICPGADGKIAREFPLVEGELNCLPDLVVKTQQETIDMVQKNGKAKRNMKVKEQAVQEDTNAIHPFWREIYENTL